MTNTTINSEMQKAFNRLWQNVNMSAKSGAAGNRTTNNPKKSGRLRENQSTKRHQITITKQDLIDLWYKQRGLCAWLKIPMSLSDLFVSHSPFAPSVDRIDNKKGYHKDNIVLTTRFANKGRGCYDSTAFCERLISLLQQSEIVTNKPSTNYSIETLW